MAPYALTPEQDATLNDWRTRLLAARAARPINHVRLSQLLRYVDGAIANGSTFSAAEFISDWTPGIEDALASAARFLAPKRAAA